MKARKALTSQLEIILFLTNCARNAGIKCYETTTLSDAKAKIITSNLSEKNFIKN